MKLVLGLLRLRKIPSFHSWYLSGLVVVQLHSPIKRFQIFWWNFAGTADSVSPSFDPFKKFYLSFYHLFRLLEDGRGLFKKKASTTSTVLEPKPRLHSHVVEDDISAISRAKMRSVQQTVTIVLTYIASSTPFILAQLWAVWGSPSQAVSKYRTHR